MMLRHLGQAAAADAVEGAIRGVLAKSKVRTPDLGGKATTRDMGEAIRVGVSDASTESRIPRP
jgi:tartrate dehydrogenase/decarboxylase / D-malate dehydrogenase